MRETLAIILFVGACVGSAADHEAVGDEKYVVGAYRDAIAEYRLALQDRPADPNLLAKLGAAALRATELAEATQAYRALSRHEDRRDEAEGGLWRVARAAAQAGEPTALLQALRAVRAHDPESRLGPYAIRAAREELAGGSAAEALALLPHAVAAADGRLADSLLFAYAELTARVGRCVEATRVYEALIRRGRAPQVLDDARAGLARCALTQGQQALERGDPQAAERYFRRAASPAAPLEIVRAAWLGLGDVRLALGDIAGAVEAFEEARAGLPPEADSIARAAAARLNAIGSAEGVRR